MMEAILREGLSALSLPTEGIPALTRYAGLLAEKNQVMNLTAITDPAGVARLHFLDSAALLALADLRGKRVVDVGTGAGFPGLPLKILEPSIRLTLLDAQRKRVDFLREVCEELGLGETESVDMIFRCPEFNGINYKVAHLPAVGSRLVSTSGCIAVCAICMVAVIISGGCQIQVGIIAFRCMAIGHVHYHPDASIVQRLHHLFHFPDTCGRV